MIEKKVERDDEEAPTVFEFRFTFVQDNFLSLEIPGLLDPIRTFRV